MLWLLSLLSDSTRPSSTIETSTTPTLDSRHWNDPTYSRLTEKVRGVSV